MDQLESYLVPMVIIAVYAILFSGNYKIKRMSVDVFYWLLFVFGVASFAALSKYGQPWVTWLLPLTLISGALVWYLNTFWYDFFIKRDTQRSGTELTERSENAIQSIYQKNKQCDWCSTEIAKGVKLEEKASWYCSLTCEGKFKMAVLGITTALWLLWVSVFGWPDHYSMDDY